MPLDKSKANVFVRGKHTLFMFTASKPNGTKRDVDLARQQLATILNVPLARILANHDYEGKPADAAFVFRYKAALPARVHTPSLAKGEKGQFIAKEVVFHFPEGVKEAPQRQGKPLGEMPGTEEDEPEAEAKLPGGKPSNFEDIVLMLMERQDRQAEQLAAVMEIIRQIALQGHI